MIIYLQARLTSLACSDILACDEDARFEVQAFFGSIAGQGSRREYFLSRSKSLHPTLENKLFISLSVKVTV